MEVELQHNKTRIVSLFSIEYLSSNIINKYIPNQRYLIGFNTAMISSKILVWSIWTRHISPYSGKDIGTLDFT